MKPTSESPSLSRAAVVWSSVLLLAAIALLVGGGVRRNFAPEPSGRVADGTRLPRPLEPLGELEAPPVVFRWEAGGPDVDYSQILVFNERQERIWSSAPLTGSELTVDPQAVFGNLAAGPPVFWSVREVAGGRPRATSPMVEFLFLVDVQGRGIGESQPGEALIDG